jgi:anti-anti-sigma factor
MAQATITFEDVPSNVPDNMVKIVKIVGQLDESNVDDKAKEIYAVIEAHPKNLGLIFDLSGLEYMNSKSVGYLTDWYQKVTEAQGNLVVIGARPNIHDILQVVGLTQLISFYQTLDEAKFSLMKK